MTSERGEQLMTSEIFKYLEKLLMQCTCEELTSITCSAIKVLTLKIASEETSYDIPSQINLRSENELVRWDFTVNIKEAMTDKGKKDYEEFCASPDRIKRTMERLHKEGYL